MAPVSRRAALAALLVSGLLGAATALIAWQTAIPPRDARADANALPPEAPAPLAAPTGATSVTAVAPTASVPAVTPGPDLEAERTAAAEIRSLVAAGKVGTARARANAYYERFPNGPSAAELERLTGAHPTTDTRP